MQIIKKNITFITPLYIPANISGSSFVTKQLAEIFADEKFAVSVITSNALTARYWYDPIWGKKIQKTVEVINAVTITRLSCNQFYSSIMYVLVRKFYKLFDSNTLNTLKIKYNGPYLKQLKQQIQRQKSDIIHCSTFPLGLSKQVIDIITHNKNCKKPKIIITPFYHSEINDFQNPALKQILHNVDAIHVVSNAEKHALMNIFEIDSKKILVIPLFLDIKKMKTAKELIIKTKEFKEQYRITKREIVLFAGNKGFMKGAPMLLEVVDALYRKDKKVLLIAIGNSTNEWEDAKKKVNKDCLLDFGYVSNEEKEIIFNATDIYCMPSLSESFGLTYLEAWHKRKPVIGADIPAVRELIKNNNAGEVVSFGDKDALTMSIERLLTNKQKAKRLGENGYRALMNKYSLAVLFPEYKKMFLS
jgi:glycosyltransferase involved in cell wall biosynthesis